MSNFFQILTGSTATIYDVKITLQLKALLEWAYLALQGEITFFLTLNFTDRSVSSERKNVLSVYI